MTLFFFPIFVFLNSLCIASWSGRNEDRHTRKGQILRFTPRNLSLRYAHREQRAEGITFNLTDLLPYWRLVRFLLRRWWWWREYGESVGWSVRPSLRRPTEVLSSALGREKQLRPPAIPNRPVTIHKKYANCYSKKKIRNLETHEKREREAQVAVSVP